MTFDFIAIPDDQVPHAVDPAFEHLLVCSSSLRREINRG